MDELTHNELRIKDDRIRNLEAALADRERKLEVAHEDAQKANDRVALLEGQLAEIRAVVDRTTEVTLAASLRLAV